MSMDQKDFDRMKELLREQREKILSSKTYAKKLLIELGLLTTRGTIPKYRRRARKIIP
jgi:hypothetical protein